jgi:peptidoglycan/xylan/chitin deacetylase (PgdA/CDA1 family)
MQVARTFELSERIACLTLDFEEDYDDLIGEFNILNEHEPEIMQLADSLKRLETPLSIFIRTDLLERYARSGSVLRALGQDFHCHSHTHATREFDSDFEIHATVKAFERHFQRPPIGYRAPLGVLYPGDLERLREHGFRFSASVFPSWRPGKFNNLSAPLEPFEYSNGLLELPFAAVPRLRYTISMSYLKLLGYTLNGLIWSTFGLPKVMIIDSHLHDFIVAPKSFKKLPLLYRIGWGRNRGAGLPYLRRLVQTLKAKGYRFITMTELAERIEAARS